MRLACQLLAVAGALLLCRCGYVGDPLPPALHIPATVQDFRAWQRGAKLAVAFTIPALTTDGLAIQEVREVELRIGVSPKEWNVDEWLGATTAFELPDRKPGPVQFDVSGVDRWTGKEIVVGVRLTGAKGRKSAWSNFATTTIAPPLATPTLAAQPAPSGVKLIVTGVAPRPGLTFRITRKAPTEEWKEIAQAPAPEYVDTDAKFGLAYEYQVQAAVPSGNTEALSDKSQVASITPADVFPPAVPRALTANAGINSIELAWDRNTETDLHHYRVYRAVGDQPLEILADQVEAPAFSDRTIEQGKTYRYAISAVDQLENESARSAEVKITAP